MAHPLESMRKDKQNLSAYAGEGAATLRAAKEDAKEMAHNVNEAVKGFFTTRKRELMSTADKCTSAIRARPVQSSLVALGAGVLLARLLRR